MITVTMGKHEWKLLLTFLEDYSDKLSTAGSNDWDFPENWTKEDREQFLKEYQIFNKSEEPHTYLDDFMALWVLQKKINKQIE